MKREQIIEILRCNSYDCFILSDERLGEIADEILSRTQQDEPSVSEWVSVEERLPEDDLFVIVWYGEADSFGIASYKDETWSESYRGWVPSDMITHWKELYNNPPKTEK
jgi:hypothetical protein